MTTALVSDKIIPALKEAAKAGVDVDAALDQLANLVELAGRPSDRLHFKTIKTEIGISVVTGKPVIVGWDTCAECMKHISLCGCAEPKMPDYIARWVAELSAAVPTPVGSPQISEVPFSPEATSDSGDSQIRKSAPDPEAAPEPDASEGLSPCEGCGTPVDATMADVQDNGTLMCFKCQEAS